MRNAYKIFIGMSEWKRKLGSPGRKWEEKIKTDLKEIEWGGGGGWKGFNGLRIGTSGGLF
jgi:hypothetical protein